MNSCNIFIYRKINNIEIQQNINQTINFNNNDEDFTCLTIDSVQIKQAI